MNNPVPIERRLLEGNKSHRALPETQGSIPADLEIPQAPAHLDAAGQEAWLKIFTYCGAWITSATDGFLVERYCELQDRKEEFKAQVGRDGLMIETDRGALKAHPLLSKITEIEKMLLSMEAKLGLTPVDRVHLGVTISKGLDDLENRERRRAKRERKQIDV